MVAFWEIAAHSAYDSHAPKIHACKLRVYSGVQILLGVSKWRTRTQILTGVYLHMGKFTPGSDQMQILFLPIHV